MAIFVDVGFQATGNNIFERAEHFNPRKGWITLGYKREMYNGVTIRRHADTKQDVVAVTAASNSNGGFTMEYMPRRKFALQLFRQTHQVRIRWYPPWEFEC